jgi:hypothetical protein
VDGIGEIKNGKLKFSATSKTLSPQGGIMNLLGVI